MECNQMDNDCIIQPKRLKGEKRLPPSGIFLPNPGEAKIAADALLERGGKKRFFFHSTLFVSSGNDFFIAGPAVGAPMAVLCLEKLIALGATRIIVASCCGSLDESIGIGDIILPTDAISGEGTSKYYQQNGSKPDSRCKPDSRLTKALGQLLLAGDISEVHRGVIWSTDAPYRESRSQLASLQKNFDIIGVDMEFSALCAVAAFRRISLAAVLVVSDLLWSDTWKPGFNDNRFKNKSAALIGRLLDDRLDSLSFE